MKQNSFVRIMQSKSDAELKSILEDRANYTFDALQAVVCELEKRELIEKDEIILEKPIQREVIKPKVEQQKIELPTLYSKQALLGFTVFFSTIFGVVLLMSNLKIMKKSKERIQVLLFGISFVFLNIFLIDFLPKNFLTTLIINFIGYLILAEYFWNKSLGKELRYKKKPIAKPLIISLLITFFLLLIIMLPFILDIETA